MDMGLFGVSQSNVGSSLSSISKRGHPKAKCRKLKPGEKIISPVYKGPRGGYYFYAGGIKVYLPKDEASIKYAKKMYG